MGNPPRPTKMLIAGGVGFLGRAIANAAAAEGFAVHVTWRTRQPGPGVVGHRASIDQPGHIAAILDRVAPDVVVNAIGGPHRPQSAEEKLAAWRDSAVATTSLLEACRHRGTRFVHLASSHEFAPSPLQHDEASAIGPVSLRGVAANAATSAVRLWASETGAPTVILRPFSVYGPGEPEDRVVPTVLRAAMTGVPFKTTATPSSRDLVFVDDIAQAAIAACHDEVTGEFNLGSGVGTTVPELIAAAEAATGRTIDVVHGEFEPRPWDRGRWVSDPSRAAAVLGWKAETTLIDGLRRSLA